MPDLLHELFLPYSADVLRQHFIDSDAEGEDPERHLAKWRDRIAKAPSKDPSYLERDETIWTANALLAIHSSPDSRAVWRRLLAALFGPTPPTRDSLSWDDLLGEDLHPYFEVGLPSPKPYRKWLSNHLDERHALPTQLATAQSRGTSLEGRTHLDALLLSPSTGFALHVEAKVLSDIDTKTTHDLLRNQLARNLDCMTGKPADHPVLGKRDPDRSFLVLLTPELFQRNWTSRLYGRLIREYQSEGAAVLRDLRHLDADQCASLSRRIGWLTFEDIRAVEPSACRWLG